MFSGRESISRMNLPLTGLIAAPFTPFKADRSLNLPMIPNLVEMLVAQGVTGAFICGTTGEGSSLSTPERKDVAAAWVQAAAGRLKVIVHVGHNSVLESSQLAAHAASVGADAVGSTAPSFFKPSGEAALVETCQLIESGAPSLPFYYYHIPSMTGLDFPMGSFVDRALEQIPNFAGVKFTHENLMDFARAVDRAGTRAQILFGRDEILLAGLTFGATAAVGSTYNYAGELYNELIEAAAEGDLVKAMELQRKSIAFITAFLPYGGLPAQKAMMAMCGFDCGPVRAPLQNLPAAKVAALKADLQRIGFFDYAAAAERLAPAMRR
jgi:N-acetylneuraminate lyase